jgi:DNA modification methylase
MDLLRSLPANSIDAVVTDPPYGLGKRWNGGSSYGWKVDRQEAQSWDSAPLLDLSPLLTIAKYVIIWGGQYYPLPPARGWLIWDKKQEHTTGHAELAWTNLDQPIRTFRMSRVEAYSRMNKQHPTQKPVALMDWCLSFLPEDCTVLDPFMGSGTTGVACVKTGRNFIGIEKEQAYFNLANDRILRAEAEIAVPLLVER